jgi:hypothetical protein
MTISEFQFEMVCSNVDQVLKDKVQTKKQKTEVEL